MHAECEADLAAVMEIVLNEVPDDPLFDGLDGSNRIVRHHRLS